MSYEPYVTSPPDGDRGTRARRHVTVGCGRVMEAVIAEVPDAHRAFDDAHESRDLDAMCAAPLDQDVGMSTLPTVPQFGALLRSHIESVPEAARPAFLSGLERSAAARYRQWAEAAPEYGEVLLQCAAREDEIAELVAGLFPVSPEVQQAVDEALPAAVALYYEVFAPYDVLDQLYLQSEAELQGAQAWVGIAAGIDHEAARDTLARCTALEQQSAAAVKELLAGIHR